MVNMYSLIVISIDYPVIFRCELITKKSHLTKFKGALHSAVAALQCLIILGKIILILNGRKGGSSKMILCPMRSKSLA